MASQFYTTKYFPISNSETCVDAPLTTGFATQQAYNLLNAKEYVHNFKVVSEAYIPAMQSMASNTSEIVLTMFAPRYIPADYNYLRFAVGNQRFAGTSNCEIRVYSSSSLYTKDIVLDTEGMQSQHSVAFNCTSDTHAINYGSTLQIKRDAQELNYIIVTAKNYDSSTRANITTIDIWPSLG